jgi:hypothetical protein
LPCGAAAAAGANTDDAAMGAGADAEGAAACAGAADAVVVCAGDVRGEGADAAAAGAASTGVGLPTAVAEDATATGALLAPFVAVFAAIIAAHDGFAADAMVAERGWLAGCGREGGG